jgi:phosphoribosylanthranilate isomerase
VGVFVNTPGEEIRRLMDVTGIRLVQLHGDETPQEASDLGAPVWKTFRVGPAFDATALAAYNVDGYLLDTMVDGMMGGTGKTFNWQIAVGAKQYGPVILSGGITPDNVQQAIREVSPYAIDVSSGVEASPGRKDPARIARLFDAIRR